jgi:hypothetical protein
VDRIKNDSVSTNLFPTLPGTCIPEQDDDILIGMVFHALCCGLLIVELPLHLLPEMGRRSDNHQGRKVPLSIVMNRGRVAADS